MPPPSGRCLPGQPTVRRRFSSGLVRVKLLLRIVTEPETRALEAWAPPASAGPAVSTAAINASSRPVARSSDFERRLRVMVRFFYAGPLWTAVAALLHTPSTV